MAQHKFKIGQVMDFLPGALDRNLPRGHYRIERLLPSEGGVFHYRVRHLGDNHERVVAENQLIRSAAPREGPSGGPKPR
jgi:hypothetical protein